METRLSGQEVVRLEAINKLYDLLRVQKLQSVILSKELSEFKIPQIYTFITALKELLIIKNDGKGKNSKWSYLAEIRPNAELVRKVLDKERQIRDKYVETTKKNKENYVKNLLIEKDVELVGKRIAKQVKQDINEYAASISLSLKELVVVNQNTYNLLKGEYERQLKHKQLFEFLNTFGDYSITKLGEDTIIIQKIKK